MLVRKLKIPGYERVLQLKDSASGYRAIVALHTRVDGCAYGGTRMRPYPTDAEALRDVLRLAAVMTLKANAAGLRAGGAKAVIMQSAGTSRDAILACHAEMLNRLQGEYISAPDVGMSHDDLVALLENTPFVTSCRGPAGEAAEHTARGTMRAIEAAVAHRLEKNDLHGVSVAIQGCGQVGAALAHQLVERGAILSVCDVEPHRAATVSRETGATVVSPDDIMRTEVDVLAPCALGGIINEATIPAINATIVAGAANNQLSEEADGERLNRRRITYVPDHIASAGGLISGFGEYNGWSLEERLRRIDDIARTTAAALGREPALR